MITGGLPVIQYSNNQDPCKNKAGHALASTAESFVEQSRGCLRLARLLTIFAITQEIDVSKYAHSLGVKQGSDGGWSDVEETIWCIAAVNQSARGRSQMLDKAWSWLSNVQHKDGGWGLSDRDGSRIITTSLLLTLQPKLANNQALRWISGEWQKDLSAEIKLTYKGGFTLMALAAHRYSFDAGQLVDDTFAYLSREQNDDGGFGPWKNHPIGSDPWSTGITLVGLTSWPEKVDREVVQKSVDWLCRNQLDSGLWRYHFIDEGSAYAYWGLTSAIDYLESAN